MNHFISNTKKKIYYLLFLLIANLLYSNKSNKIENFSLLPNVSKEMLKASYWIEPLNNPDEPWLTKKQIQEWNKKLYRKGHQVHPTYENEITSGVMIKNQISNELKSLRRYYKYDSNGIRYRDPGMSQMLLKNLNIEKIRNSQPVHFGLTKKAVNIRSFPIHLKLFSKSNNQHFDILQKTTINPFSEIAILHQSTDRQWIYIQSIDVQGWIFADSYYPLSKAELVQYIEEREKKGLVVLIPKAKILKSENEKMSKIISPLSMGNKILVKNSTKKNEKLWQIQLPPSIKTIYLIEKNNIGKVLILNQRNIIQQAFKYLHQPYSWGNLHGNTDCSGLLRNIFATTGLKLPRSSVLQSRFWQEQIIHNKTRSQQFKGIDKFPGFSLFSILGPNHIMLYLGKSDNRIYVLHNTWSYYLPNQTELILAKVVVSDLSIISKHKKTLKDRIYAITTLPK